MARRTGKAVPFSHAETHNPGGLDPVEGVPAGSLQTTGADVDVSASAPPDKGEVLMATSATTATWQHPGYARALLLMGG